MFALAQLDSLLPPGIKPAERLREIDVLNENRLEENAAEHAKLSIFKQSRATHFFFEFILALNSHVANVKISDVKPSGF